MGQEKWGEKIRAQKVEREKWDEKSGAKRKVGLEKWG